jgi:hypothetical protein
VESRRFTVVNMINISVQLCRYKSFELQLIGSSYLSNKVLAQKKVRTILPGAVSVCQVSETSIPGVA